MGSGPSGKLTRNIAGLTCSNKLGDNRLLIILSVLWLNFPDMAVRWLNLNDQTLTKLYLGSILNEQHTWYIKCKGKGIGFIVLSCYNLPVTLPDILNKPTVMTRCYTQHWHTWVHVRYQVVVSRVCNSVISMMQQPIRWELNSARSALWGSRTRHCTMTIYMTQIHCYNVYLQLRFKYFVTFI